MSSSDHKNQNLKIIWYFFKPYKGEVCFILFLMILSGAFESLNLAALYPIVNYGLQVSSDQSSLNFLNQIVLAWGKDNPFFFACALLIVVTIVATGFKLYYSYRAYGLIRKIDADVQKQIYLKFAKADYNFFIKNQQGRLIYASTQAPTGVSNIIFYLIRILNGIFICLFCTALLFLLSWQGTALMIGVGLVYIWGVRKVTTGLINQSAELWVEQNNLKNIILNEFITGIKTMKIFSALDFWRRKYDDTIDKSVLYNFRIMIGRIIPDSFIKFIFFVLIASLGMFYSYSGSANIIPLLPAMATFVAVASRLFPYINMVGGDIVSIARFMPDTKIVHATLTENLPELKDGSKTCEAFNHKITFDNVRFKYQGTEKYILNGLTFDIEKGKVTAIVGSSGAGKSTIVNLILKLYASEEGAIQLDGVNISEFNTHSYLSKIGCVSQDTFIFNGSILENICFGLEDKSEDQVIEAAKLANAHEFILNTKDQYRTMVGDSGAKLSGGQRQRIAIARAMLRKPRILVLDEATSSLDTISERAVQVAINNISSHTTVLIIAHRLSTVQNAGKIIVMDHGQIVEQGTHDELMKRQNAYFKLYSTTQMEVAG